MNVLSSACSLPFKYKPQKYRAPIKPMLSLCLAMLFSACTNAPVKLPIVEPGAYEGSVQNILVATSRSPHEDTSLRYGDRRSDQLYFDAVDVWTPANRKPGTVNYPSKEPDPDHEFGVVSINSLSRATFEQTVKARLDDLDGDKIVFIFVHGYNVPYANGIYRHAQLLEDFDARGLAIHYSWPSSGRSLGYLYDRDSVQFARDGFVSLLTSVAASEADSIFVMGHSMGTLLVMESIRQLSLSQHADVLEKISPLVLASPDIDIDVFRAQLRVIEPRPDPIVVFVSRKDGALKLSEQLRGGRARVGDGSNIPALQEAGIVVIDLSDIDVGEGTKHGAFASSPALIRALKEVNVAQDTQRSADNQEFDPIAPLVALRDLTAGIVHLPKAVGSDDEVK